jgi:hypothetical protein
MFKDFQLGQFLQLGKSCHMKVTKLGEIFPKMQQKVFGTVEPTCVTCVCVCVLSSGYSGSVLITQYQSLDLFRSMTFPPYPKPQ